MERRTEGMTLARGDEASPLRNCSTDATRLRNSGWSGSPSQCERSAVWILLNSSGSAVDSIIAGTRMPRFSASPASVFTQLDVTEVFDQSTISHLAELSAYWMTSSKTLPGGIVRSHHTE